MSYHHLFSFFLVYTVYATFNDFGSISGPGAIHVPHYSELIPHLLLMSFHQTPSIQPLDDRYLPTFSVLRSKAGNVVVSSNFYEIGRQIRSPPPHFLPALAGRCVDRKSFSGSLPYQFTRSIGAQVDDFF